MPRPALTRLEAQLFVADVVAACAFYGKLGFEIVFTYGEPPFYAQVRRDAAAINLRMVDEPVYVGDVRERESLLGASITLGSASDLQALFETFQADGVPFHQPIKQQPWGAHDFIVRDPDGNLVLFASPAS